MNKTLRVLFFMLLAALLPNVASAQNVAKIGETGYSSLKAAFDAANEATSNTTITLQSDVTLTETITLNPTKTVTFDLNGHTVSSTLDTTFKLTKGTLYVKDLGTTKGGISVSGEAFRIDSRESGVTSRYGAQLYIYENVNVTSSADCCVFIRGFATVNTSGNLTSNGTYATIQGNGSDTQGSEINVKGGFVKSTQEAAIYHPQKGKLTISGGTVEGKGSGVAIKAGTLDVYGNSVIRATGPSNIPTTGWSDGVNASGCAIQIESNPDYDANGVSVTIRTVTSTNVPTIESTNGAAVYEYVGKGSNTMLSTLKITGGTFTGGSGQQALLTSEQAANAKAVTVSGGSFSSAVNAAYCADGYAPTDNGNGTYGVTLQNEAKIGETYYTTFTAAADAAGANDVIVLLAKPAAAYTMPTADKTLKVEKKTFSCTINAYEGYVIASTTADGVTTYTQTAAKVKFTAASNGAVTYLSNIDNSWSKAGTYQLLDDISWTRVPVSANVTLDLNGHTWTSTQDADFNVLFFKSGSNNLTLNIVDTSVEKGGKIVNTTANGIIGISNSGNTVNIGEGVILEGNSVVITGTNNTLNVDGTINGGNTFAIATNGSQTTNATINIKSGAVVTSNDVAVYLPGTGTTTVKDGATITGATAIYQKSGTLNIEGGTITGNGAAANYTYNGNGANSTGGAVVVDNCGYPGGAPVPNITGGTFRSENAAPVATYNTENATPVTGFVSGGSFNKQLPADVIVENWICPSSPNAEGNMFTLEEGSYVAQIGEYGYETLEAAFAAVQNGETIEMLTDVTIADKLILALGEKAVTLDLGGNTLNGRTNLTSGNLTIQNGTVAGGAQQALNVYGSATTAKNYSVLTIASNVIVTADVYGVCLFGPSYSSKPGYGAVVNIAGTVTTTGDSHNGAVFVSGNLGQNIAGDMNNVINISGTITSATDAAVALNGNATVNVLDGASITGNTGIAVKRGNLNVSGGSIAATGVKVESPAANGNGVELTGAGISMTPAYSQYGNMNVVITGGTVTSTNADALFKQEGSYTSNAVYAVSGGSFSSVVPQVFCTTGYEPVTEAVNGMYTVEVATSVELEDGQTYTLNNDIDDINVTYKRSFGSERVGKFQGWFVPFAYTLSSDDVADFDFFKINTIAHSPVAGSTEVVSDKIWIHLNKLSEGTELYPNWPYIFRPKASQENYEFMTRGLKAKANGRVAYTATMTEEYSFYGVYEPISPTTQDQFYYMNIYGEISLGNDKSLVTVNPLRWIIRVEDKDGTNQDLTEAAREIFFVVDGQEASAIQSVESNAGIETYYTLDGVQVQQPAKGIYLKKSANGQTKKVFIK